MIDRTRGRCCVARIFAQALVYEEILIACVMLYVKSF